MKKENNSNNNCPIISKKTKRNYYKSFYKLIGSNVKIERRLYKVFITALFVIASIFIVEILSIVIGKFIEIEKDGKTTTMGVDDVVGIIGPIGDFFGGILNPLLSFCTFMALLMTIILQQKELSLTRKELSETQKATRDSAEALKEQSNSIKIQNFENTFFNMINLHKEIISNLSLMKLEKDWVYGGKSIWAGTKQSIPEKDRIYLYTILDQAIDIEENNDLYGKKVISKLFEILNCYIKEDKEKSLIDLYLNFFKEYNEIIGHYFRNIYQILKFIKKTSEKNEFKLDSKFYTNILRAQLSNSELALLFLNALSKYGKEELFPLLIEYEFMEPLPISIIDNSYLDKILELCDNPKIFGKNEEWLEYINTSSQEQQ